VVVPQESLEGGVVSANLAVHRAALARTKPPVLGSAEQMVGECSRKLSTCLFANNSFVGMSRIYEMSQKQMFLARSGGY
jgi:hypothetical protein